MKKLLRRRSGDRPAPAMFIAGVILAVMALASGTLLLAPVMLQAAGPGGTNAQGILHLPFVIGGEDASQGGPSQEAKPTGRPSKTPRTTATPTATATLTSAPRRTAQPTATPGATATVTATATPSPTVANTATPTPTASPTNLPLDTSHAGRFDTYEGSKTCNACHAQEAKEVHGSLHYQWQAPAPYVPGLSTGGKLGAINDFCGYANINWLGILTNLDGQPTDGGCATCHAGMGARPEAQQTTAQLENIDCLICHSDTYKRKVVSENGAFKLAPAPERMSVPLLQAITDIGEPSKATCLNCHLSSGGGPNNKRGDLEPAHVDPSRNLDVHMASKANGGAGLVCQDCHTTQEHKIAGRGSDMRGTDLDVPVRCVNCHSPTPHDSNDINKHTAKVECSACHIPTFARETSTDMYRDFREVEELPVRRLYEPKITRGANVIPQYRWLNGTSTFYEFGDAVTYQSNGRVLMSGPLGDVNDPNSKLFAFKYHTATQAYDPAGNRILPLKMGILFQDGDVDRAIREGAKAVGWDLPQNYEYIPTDRWLSINHEVAPEEQALRCDTCHADTATRLDWPALGYTPKNTRNDKPLCESCHGPKDEDWSNFFYGLHDKHVKDKKIACFECHTFQR